MLMQVVDIEHRPSSIRDDTGMGGYDLLSVRDDVGVGVVVVHGCPLETMLGLSWLCVSGGRCMRWYVPDSELFVVVGGGGGGGGWWWSTRRRRRHG